MVSSDCEMPDNCSLLTSYVVVTEKRVRKLASISREVFGGLVETDDEAGSRWAGSRCRDACQGSNRGHMENERPELMIRRLYARPLRDAVSGFVVCD